MNKIKLKDNIDFEKVNEKSIMKFDFNLSNYFDKETRIFKKPNDYVAASLMGDVMIKFLIPLELVEKGENNENN